MPLLRFDWDERALVESGTKGCQVSLESGGEARGVGFEKVPVIPFRVLCNFRILSTASCTTAFSVLSTWVSSSPDMISPPGLAKVERGTRHDA